ncbi:uncharacterized protein KY384_007301 [Bacidia gigantensis]|uniref:uncharacterized protein n=1 Tax=Bacidia gigantensis TaxID=2732470 RepID=UPI001D05BB24|nr:uncharacterized protein KY384_007301 [Bacidia gigantensis]KAG8528383.1 hypothetical protein KY384_007301 [Bacidia gigantensis]
MSSITLRDALGNSKTSGIYITLIALAALFIYTLYGAIWRLYLTPIAHIPGPWFAKLTFWNEFYYDVVLGGKYTWKIADYHAIYGPIIRINPFEVHIMDPEFHEELYVHSNKRKSNKWFWSMRMFGQQDNSAFDTLDHDKHRMRREPWNPYFSKQSVSRLQPLLIQSCVNKLCDRLAEHRDAGKPVIMTYAYACLTVDVISEYSFPAGTTYLDQPSFDQDHYQAWMALSKISHTLKQFGWLYPFLSSMPMWVTKYTSPETYLVLQQMELLKRQTTEIIARRQGTSDYKESTGRPSLMEAILDSRMPSSEKTIIRVAGAAQIAIGAGTLTSSHALKHATYHILANPPIHSKLMSALEAAIPDPDAPPNLKQLESIDYLLAIWFETLRNFHGVTHRLQRICPDRSLHFQNVEIPAGTPVGMTSVHVHNNPDIFPDPYAFRPERWLPLASEGQRLQRYILAFGKGSRQCVGMELGRAEVLTGLANVFRRFGRGMRLKGTERVRDIDVCYDVFNPMPSRESNMLVVEFGK